MYFHCVAKAYFSPWSCRFVTRSRCDTSSVRLFAPRTNLELELVHRGGNLCSGGASAAAKRSCLSEYSNTFPIKSTFFSSFVSFKLDSFQISKCPKKGAVLSRPIWQAARLLSFTPSVRSLRHSCAASVTLSGGTSGLVASSDVADSRNPSGRLELFTLKRVSECHLKGLPEGG